MSQKQRKSHQDPITYRAYGKVKGFYKPRGEDIGKGSFITEDGTTFAATLTGEALAKVGENFEKLNQIGIWRCYFRTHPHSLQLIRVNFSNLEYKGKIGVDDFRVVGEVVDVEGQKLTVRIKKNKGTRKTFNLSLKGTFDYDPSHKFYRFVLKREGKIYRIVRYQKTGILPLFKNEKKEVVNQSQALPKQNLIILKIIKKT